MNEIILKVVSLGATARLPDRPGDMEKEIARAATRAARGGHLLWNSTARLFESEESFADLGWVGGYPRRGEGA